MRLRNKPSMVSTMPEKKAPGSWISQLSKIIYYLVLIYIVSYAGFHIYRYFANFRGTGYVEVEKTIISTARGGTVTALNIRESESLQKDELIAVLKPDDDCIDRMREKTAELEYQLEQNINRQSLLINKLQAMNGLPSEQEFTIAHKNGELGLVNQQIMMRKDLLGEFRLRRALEADESYRNERDRLDREILELEHEANLLRTEISIQQQRDDAERHAMLRSQDELQFEVDNLESEIELLTRRLQDVQKQKGADGNYSICADEIIYASENAYVTHVSKKLNEYAAKGEPITSLILDSSSVSIESYFDESELEYIYPDKIVDLEFPDGRKSRGRVFRVQSTAYNRPERIWNDYMPAQSEIRVDIAPLNEQDKKLWHGYDRIQLRVTGARYE